MKNKKENKKKGKNDLIYKIVHQNVEEMQSANRLVIRNQSQSLEVSELPMNAKFAPYL